MQKADSVKRIYVLKKMNEARLNETYAENRLKRFKIRKMRVENIEKKKINLTRSLRGAEKFEKMIEIIEKNFEENFEMKEKNSDQIEKLRKNRRDAQNSSRNAVELINDENEVLENNVMIINFDYNVAEDAVVVVKTENENIAKYRIETEFSK